MLSESLWPTFGTHLRDCLRAKFDSARLPPEWKSPEELQMAHKGFYIGLANAAGQPVVRTGFLKEDSGSLLDSANRVIEACYTELKANNVSSVDTLTFHFTVVLDVLPINHGLMWDENVDGVYFSWNDIFNGFLLPYQI